MVFRMMSPRNFTPGCLASFRRGHTTQAVGQLEPFIPSAERKAFYKANGYLPKFPLLDPHEVKRTYEAYRSFAFFSENTYGAFAFESMHISRNYNGSLRAVNNPHILNPFFECLARKADLLNTVKELVGCGTQGVYLVRSDLHIKWSVRNGSVLPFTFPWHSDVPFFKDEILDPEKSLFVFIYLTACEENNGPVKIIPQTASLAWPDKQMRYELGGTLPPIWSQEEIRPLAQKNGIISMTSLAGDCFFLHPNTLHSSEQNTSSNHASERVLLILAYNTVGNTSKPQGSELPRSLEPFEGELTHIQI